MQEADSIIRKYTTLAMGGAIIPLPIVDLVTVTAIQVDMTYKLCLAYQVDYYEAATKAVLSSLATSSVAKLGASLIKLLPTVGTVVGGLTSAVLSGASTYASGEVIKRHFENGGTLENLEVEDYQLLYNEMFEKGKILVKEWDEEVSGKVTDSSDEPTIEETDTSYSLDNLKELERLHAEGLLSDEEHDIMKRKLYEEYLKRNLGGIEEI